MSLAKSIYHRIIPARVREPVGLVRRRIGDRLTRAVSPHPLPPASLLVNVQMTPFVSEFIKIGSRSAASIQSALAPALRMDRPRVLDFGCGCGRTLIQLRRSGWELFGCDVDRPAVEWLQRSFEPDHFIVNDPAPPLPYARGSFDALYAVSVFTHFSPEEQRSWAAELGRILAPGGLAAITSMGPGILSNFPVHDTAANRAQLAADGRFYVPSTESFNARAAFHTPEGLARALGPEFELWQFAEQGLDGFQDLSVFVRQ